MRHPFHTKIQFNYKTKLPPLQRWECEKRLNKCWDVLASLCEGGGQGNVPYTISVCLDTDSTMPISPSNINKLVPPDEKNGRLMPVFGIVFVTTAMFRIACSVTCTTNPTTSSAPNLSRADDLRILP